MSHSLLRIPVSNQESLGIALSQRSPLLRHESITSSEIPDPDATFRSRPLDDTYPPEIRVKIYNYYFQSTVVAKLPKRGPKYFETSPRLREARFAPLNLFLTSRIVRQEAEPIFYRLALFWYDTNLARLKLASPSVPGHLPEIQNLVLLDLGVKSETQSCIDVALDKLDTPEREQKMQYLNVINPVLLPNGLEQIHPLIISSKDRVETLELCLQVENESPHTLNLDEATGKLKVRRIRRLGHVPNRANQPPETSRSHRLIVKNTYEVSLQGTNGYMETCIRDLLTLVHGAEAERLKFTIEPD